MDIHRCRFVPYQPSAINAIAFSHVRVRQAKKVSLARLAIGRANGDIEIWNPHEGSWHQELIIRGGKDRSIDSLVWVNEPDQDLGDGRMLHGKSRLFSIGYTSTVTEWDLEKGRPKRHASGQHGDIWCMAAQPTNATDPTQGTKLVAGTMDGELVLYSLEDDDLRFQRVVVKSATKKAQIVSIAFQNPKVAIVGCSDSTIRAYSMSKGQLLRRMTLGADIVGGSKNIIVWAVRCLPNGNIVSGDSTGQVCIWDGKTYTQSQRIISHKADVLSLAVSADGNSILSGGMDRRTVLHRPANGTSGRWSKSWGRRYHEHDVKAMASFEGGNVSVVITGGPDARPVVLPLKDLGKNNHRTLPSLPLQSPVMGASKARFILSWWDRELHIWALPKSTDAALTDSVSVDSTKDSRKLLKTILVKGDSNITSAAINRDATLLFISTTTELKAFRLHHDSPSKPADVSVTTLNLPERVAQRGASRVSLSPDESWLSIVRDGTQVSMAQLGLEEDSVSVQMQKVKRVSRDIPRFVANGGLRSYDRNITQVAFSPDSKMLAVADLAGYVDTWVLSEVASTNGEASDEDSSADESSSDEDDEAQGGRRWQRNPAAKLLPKLPSAPVVLSFSSDSPTTEANGGMQTPSDYTLLVITSSWYILTFHPLQGQLTDWSRRNPRKALPGPIRDLLDLAQGAFWEGPKAWVYGTSFLFMIDTSQDLPSPGQEAEQSTANGSKGTKRKRSGLTTGAGGKMVKGNTVPHQVLRHSGKGTENVDMEDEPEESDVNSDEEMEDANGELSDLRQMGDGKMSSALVSKDDKKRWWITHKYRPVLGMVPLSEPGQPLEIALVERPMWDVEMADRYFAGNEYRR